MHPGQQPLANILRRVRDPTPQNRAPPQHFTTAPDKLADPVCRCKDRALVHLYWNDLTDGPVWDLNGINNADETQAGARRRRND